MSDGDTLSRAYPNNTLKKDWTLTVIACGGKGGGLPCSPMGIDRLTFSIPTDIFAVYNRKIIMFDNAFRVFDGDCYDPTKAKPIYIKASVDGNPTDAQLLASSVITGLNGASGYNIELTDLPQPSNPLYQNKIYITAYWGNSSYTNYAPPAQGTPIFRLIKYDYDIKV